MQHLHLRDRPGAPPWGHQRHKRLTASVFLTVAGDEIPSPSLLGNPRFLDRVERAAATGLVRLRRTLSLMAFLEEAERFTDKLRLGPPPVLRVLHQLRAKDVHVAQGMFGRSLFAVPLNAAARRQLLAKLESLKLRAAEIPVAPRGAEVL